MQTVPEIGVTVVVTRAQPSELPEIQSIIHANGTKVIQPSGWTATPMSAAPTPPATVTQARASALACRWQADLDRATGIVGDQYATGKFREASYSQGASYSYATSETAAQYTRAHRTRLARPTAPTTVP